MPVYLIYSPPNLAAQENVDMGILKEKRPELDPPHSKKSRDGVHTVLCDLDARILLASANESDIHEVC